MMALPFRVNVASHSAPANYLHVGTDAKSDPHQSTLYNAHSLYNASSLALVQLDIAPDVFTACFGAA